MFEGYQEHNKEDKSDVWTDVASLWYANSNNV